MSVIKEAYLSRAVTRADLLPLSFLKKSAYTGAKGQLRYKLEKKSVPEVCPDADGGQLDAVKAAEQEAEKANSAETEEAEKPELPVRTVLRCLVWETPYSLDETPDKEVRVFDFPFSDAGIDAAAACLDACHTALQKRGLADRQENALAPDPLPLIRREAEEEQKRAAMEEKEAASAADASTDTDIDTDIDTACETDAD